MSCLKTGLVGGEACPPSLRKLLSQLGCEVLQSYGTADLGLVAYESWDKEGMFCDEEVILEIVKPGSDKILEDLFRGIDEGRNNGERLFGLTFFELWSRSNNLSL